MSAATATKKVQIDEEKLESINQLRIELAEATAGHAKLATELKATRQHATELATAVKQAASVQEDVEQRLETASKALPAAIRKLLENHQPTPPPAAVMNRGENIDKETKMSHLIDFITKAGGSAPLRDVNKEYEGHFNRKPGPLKKQLEKDARFKITGDDLKAQVVSLTKAATSK